MIVKIRGSMADSAFGQIFWNKPFERSDPQFRTAPNAFLMVVTWGQPNFGRLLFQNVKR